MIEEAFAVATEFRFDVGEALIGTHSLQGAVDDLSHSANTAMGSLSYLASGLVTHLGIGSGGLLGLLTKAVTLSEEFNNGAFGFVNSISSNFRFLKGTINTFNDQLGTSRMLMDNVNKTASDLGISGPQLAMITQQVSGPLAAQGKLGTNFEGGINLAKHIMIGGEAMGVNPMMLQEQLIRGMQPGQSIGGKVFSRLMGTKAFQGDHILHPQQLSNMNLDKKFKLLSEAMKEVGENSDYLAARSTKLSVQFNMMKASIERIIKPIGDAVSVPIRKIFSGITNYLKANADGLGKSIASIIGNVFQDPESLFAGLFQLKRLGGDFKKALHMTELVQLFLFIYSGLKWLGLINGGLIKALFSGLVEGISFLFGWVMRLGIFGRIFRLLWTALAEVLPWFVAFLAIFQAISRAKAQAVISDVKDIASLTPRLAKVMLGWKVLFEKIVSPFQQMVKELANLIEPIFRTSTYLEIFVSASEMLLPALQSTGDAFLDLAADVHGFAELVKAEFEYLTSFPAAFMNAVTSSNPLSNLKDLIFSDSASQAFKRGSKDFLDHVKDGIGAPGDTTTKYTVTNNNNINARFDMREQLEPDRIAFATIAHLKKLALNPTQGRGQSHQGALAGNNS